MSSDLQPTREHSLFAGRYQLSEKLGEGGMGTVFRARDTKLDRFVAIKMFPEGSIPDPDAVARFRREARALARLSHPGIIQAYDSGEEAGRPFLVMELVEGHSLSAVLRDQGRVGPARAADFAYQAAQALHYAHKSGLVHRDVKPSNLLLSSDGRTRLLDLGLARFVQDQIGGDHLTHTGTGMGTPDYCPPEQFRDARKAEGRSDIYALGCTLYHLIAGRVPFPGSSFSEKAAAHESKEPAPLEELCPDMPGGLALVVQRMMAKRPEDRFQSMAEVAEALSPYVAGSSASFRHIRSTSTWDGSLLATVPAYPRRRQRIVALSAGVGGALLLLALGVFGLAAGWFRPGSQQIAQNLETPPADTGQQNPPMDSGKGGNPAVAEQEKPKPEAKVKPAIDPNVLTVSQKAEEGGKYRTIEAALRDVTAGQTVLVLDDAVYTETLSLTQASKFENVTLAAARRATLSFPPGTHLGIILSNVPGVVIRGFHLRADGLIGALMLVEGRTPGVVLDDLDLDVRKAPRGVGVSVEALTLDGGMSPLSIRNCRFSGGENALRLSGAPRRSARILVRDNLFTGMAVGITLVGDVSQAFIVGNRFVGVMETAVAFAMMTEADAPVLIANNSCLDCRAMLRLADTEPKGHNVRIANNLVLGARQPDMIFFEWSGKTDDLGKPGDGSLVGKCWTLDHNWREIVPPQAGTPEARAWIPPDAKKGDVPKDKMDGVNRDPKSPEFLRPDAKSSLASDGAGNEDPSLPSYVGALPPLGSEPWDWDRPWRMPKDAQLLTVSKGLIPGVKYRSINEALKDARPWATIRVLDAETYKEAITLDDKERLEGLTLEAPKRATILLTGSARYALTVRNVPRVRISGFVLRLEEVPKEKFTRVLVQVGGQCPGLKLESLELRPVVQTVSVAFQEVMGSAGEPVCIARCRIEGGTFTDGIVATGLAEQSSAPSRHLAVRDNRITGVLRGIHLQGGQADVLITGNWLADCQQEGIGIEDLTANAARVLLANNTVVNCESGLRGWLNGKFDLLAGQVEIVNNIVLDATVTDMTIILNSELVQAGPSEEKNQLAVKTWRFAGNWRDLSGNRSRIPLAPGDHKLDASVKLPRDSAQGNFLRPPSDSPLATEGVGKDDLSLPSYVGALAPEGTALWDWDRNWRMRVKSAEKK